jgi:hypothetical protein
MGKRLSPRSGIDLENEGRTMRKAFMLAALALAVTVILAALSPSANAITGNAVPPR